MLEECIENVPVRRGVVRRGWPAVGNSWSSGIDELAGAIGGDRGGVHVSLQPVEHPSKSRIRRISRIGVDHQENVGAMVARD